MKWWEKLAMGFVFAMLLLAFVGVIQMLRAGEKWGQELANIQQYVGYAISYDDLPNGIYRTITHQELALQDGQMEYTIVQKILGDVRFVAGVPQEYHRVDAEFIVARHRR